MAKLSALDGATRSPAPRESSRRQSAPSHGPLRTSTGTSTSNSTDSDSDSKSDSETDSDSDDDIRQQVLGGRRKIIMEDEDADEVPVKVKSPRPPKPWESAAYLDKQKTSTIIITDSSTSSKPWYHPATFLGGQNKPESKPIKSDADQKSQGDSEIAQAMQDLSLSTTSTEKKSSDLRTNNSTSAPAQPKPSSAKSPVPSSSSALNPLSKPTDSKPVPARTKPSASSALRPFSKPTNTHIQSKTGNLPSNSNSNSASTNSGFFERIQRAQQKQPNNRINQIPGFGSSSTSKPAQRTFGSPVRTFNSNGSLMEPLAPKSSQWSRPVDIAKAKGQPVSIFPGDDKNEISSSAFRDPPKWGMKSTDSIISRANSSVMAGNGYSYMDPSKTADAIKDLLSSMDEDEEGEGEDNDKSDGTVDGLEVTLLPHQIKGLKFLLKREDNEQKGGLLCDDMGLGKTVQSIALILSNKCDKPTSSNIKATLVIAPLALAEQWAEEIRTKSPSLRVLVHHGPSRSKDSGRFGAYDVIVTTYQIVTSEHSKNGPLFEKTWWRIIIDEAHSIKNYTTKSSIACCVLKSQYRWCLTGTPIQNKVDELYALLKFLQIGPLNDHNLWTAQISRPIAAGQGGAAIKRLRVILSAVMLRRTKEILGQSGVKLPARRKHLVHLEFDQRERRYYDDLHNKVSNAVRNIMKERGQSNYMSALLLLLRLRQVCDDIRLANGKIDGDDKESVVSAATTGKDDADDLANLFTGLNIEKNDSYLNKLGLAEGTSKENVSSTKIKKVVEIVKQSPHRKTIVFSQFTSMLDLIEPSFRNANLTFVRYDGSMTKNRREASLRMLKDDPSVQVLLCSLKCGAYGLNLTCANQVVLLDPWWNPMVGEQAIDRVHRLGQTNDVDVYELIIKNSVEDKIKLLQDKKRELSKQVIEGGGGKSANGNTLGMSELLDLFK